MMGTAVMANALDAVGRPGVDGVRAFASGVGNPLHGGSAHIRIDQAKHRF